MRVLLSSFGCGRPFFVLSLYYDLVLAPRSHFLPYLSVFKKQPCKNIYGTLNLLQLIFRRRWQKLLVASSFAVSSRVLCSLFFLCRRVSYCDAPKSPFLFLHRGKALRKSFMHAETQYHLFLDGCENLVCQIFTTCVCMGAVKNRAGFY